MPELHDVFSGALGPGLHRFDGRQPVEDLTEIVAGHGWAVLPVGLGDVADKASLLARFAEAGAFPDHVGHNWDALQDALGDLAWLGPVDGYLVLLDGWDRFAGADTADAQVLASVLTQAGEEWSERGTPFVALVL